MFGLDWLPTICSLAGCNIPWELVEGEDMSDVFYGAVRDRQTPMLWRGIGPIAAKYHDTRWIRHGPWKLVEHDKELYNLDDDPEERVNLYNEESDIVEALIKTLHEWNQTLPTDHARLPMDPLPFDPLQPVARLALPNIDLGVQGPMPTRPPTIAPSEMPTAPTGTPSALPTAPTMAPSESPTGRTGPDCETFNIVPFTAKAHQYCAFNDTTVEDSGGFGGAGGEVDIGGNLTDELQEFCGGSTFIRDTWPGEYVEYLFDTPSAIKLNITAKVASKRPRNVTLEIFSAGTSLYRHSSTTLESFTQDWYNYTGLKWEAIVPGNGTHHLRVTFNDGFTNLCGIEVDFGL